MDATQVMPICCEKNIPIVLTSSEYYLPYLSVTLQSIIDTASEANHYDILILHREIRNLAQRRIMVMAEGRGNISIRFIEIEQSLSGLSYSFREGYSPESFFRVIMAFVFLRYEKVLYLDCDVVVMRDVAELFDTDLNGYLVAAAQDPNGIGSTMLNWQGRKSYVLETMGLDHVKDYFQSGVMLFNLSEIRKTLTLEEVLKVACAPYIVWGDQDVLNIICKNRVKYLDLCWNLIINHKNIVLWQLRHMDEPDLLQRYMAARQAPAIIHYAGQQPWKKPDVDLACHFWKVARKSPFYEEIAHRMVQDSNGNSDKKKPNDIDYGKVTLVAMRIKNGGLHLWGKLCTPRSQNEYSLQIRSGMQCSSVMLRDGLGDECSIILTEPNSNVKNFCITVPLNEDRIKVSFELVFEGGDIVTLPLAYGEFSRLDDSMEESYYQRDGYIVQRSPADLKSLLICSVSEKETQKREQTFSNQCSSEVCRLRKRALKDRKKQKRPVWLVSDRVMSAEDNGFVLFQYLCDHASDNADIYFVLSSKSPDYVKVSAVGKVISPDSKKYIRLYLQAQLMIFAYADGPIVYPLRGRKGLRDLLPDYLIYLQHGVIKDDFSHDQNKARAAVDRFVTSARKERDSLLNGTYGYREDEVILTGLPRFDQLFNCSAAVSIKRNVIRVAPTWRAKMQGSQWNEKLQMCDYNERFKKSYYYKFWNNLINDERILKLMRERGYRGVFQLHPVIRSQYQDFAENDVFHFAKTNDKYVSMVQDTLLLITDFSSTAFDYALCNVPVIYSQFDECSFYHTQNYEKGYFDYECDGFGPVCRDYESTVEAIVSAIERGCILDKVYQTRAEKFFPFRDGKSCERIYCELMKL